MTNLSLDQQRRFWQRVDVTGWDECWAWSGNHIGSGYGQFEFSVAGQRTARYAHHVVYELLVGPMQGGRLYFRPSCARDCCNPWHKEMKVERVPGEGAIYRCGKCSRLLNAAAFGTYKNGRLRSDCKECRSSTEVQRVRDQTPEARAARARRHLLNKYDLTPEEYADLLAGQGGACAICGAPPPPHRRLAVDHCHDTGRVRGLLCGHCNRALGLLGESPDRVLRAHTYLSCR